MPYVQLFWLGLVFMNLRKIEESIDIIRNGLERLDTQSFIKDVLSFKIEAPEEEVTLFDSLKHLLLMTEKVNDNPSLLTEFIMEGLKICLYYDLTEKVFFSEWSAKFDAYMQNHLGSAEEIFAELIKTKQTEGDGHANSEC